MGTVDATIESFWIDAVDGDVSDVLVLHGELDLSTTPIFEHAVDALFAEGHLRANIVLDLADLTFIDGRGLLAVRLIAQRCERSDGRLQIRSPPNHVRRLLAIVDFDAIVDSSEGFTHALARPLGVRSPVTAGARRKPVMEARA